MRIFQWITVLAAIAACIGCGGKGGSPVVPPGSPDIESSITAQTNYDNPGNRYILGLGEIYVSADHRSMELVPVRSSEMHLNLVNFLDIGGYKGLEISGVEHILPDFIKVDLKFTHPFGGTYIVGYHIFDVRCILMTDSDFEFPECARRIAWSGNYPIVVNPDGYTSIFNPTEFPEFSGPPLLTYTTGKYSFGELPNSTLNPFIAYKRTSPRRRFSNFSTYNSYLETRKVWITPPDGPFSFGYAIDCSWMLLEDTYPPEANCLEPYNIETWLGPGLTNNIGSEAQIQVEVFDHQSIETIQSVVVEAPDIFNGTVEIAQSYVTGEESVMFEGIISNDLGSDDGEYPLLIRAVSSESDPNLGFLDAWDILRVTIGGNGWAKTWGGSHTDFSRGVCVSETGEIYVTGEHSGGVDLDPGPGVVTPDNWNDGGFLSRFNADGEIQQASFLGSLRSSTVKSDGAGNILLGGRFSGTKDFDPGPGTYYLTSHGPSIFLWKLDSELNLIWADSWKTGWVPGEGFWDMAVDTYGSSFVTGHFSEKIDFDKGPGTDIRLGPGLFIINYSPSGDVIWLKTMEMSDIYPNSLAFGVLDGADVLIIAGRFEGTVDFDPGPGTFELTSTGSSDAFFSIYSRDGEFISAYSWGGEEDDEIGCVNIDNSGNIWAAGIFYGTVDFDPGPGVDEFTSHGPVDFFLCKYDSASNYQFCRTWGPATIYYNDGLEVVSDTSGYIYVTGVYNTTIDLDPGPGSEIHLGNGSTRNIFISKFDPSGNFLHASVITGPYTKYCYDLDVDPSGNVYVAGYFYTQIDFNPGPEFDFHESFGDRDAFLLKVNPEGTW